MDMDNLIKNIDDETIKVRTKSLDISFNELYDMYKDGELIISPEYQRLFRWEDEKQSRFIESLILEMPIPPIFVIETDNGVYELIDGLQRISTYLRFRGESLGIKESNLILSGCDIVKGLNDKSFDDLPKTLQIKLKRSFVRMEVIKKESSISLKYHMFKRLNNCGELLSDQEIRNCTIRLIGSKYIDFLDECTKYENFKIAINRLQNEKKEKRYDQELVLRYLALKNSINTYKFPVTEFLTKYLENITKEQVSFDIVKEQYIFKKTFDFISKNWKSDAFSAIMTNGQPRNEFYLYYFDAITIAIAKNIDDIEKTNTSKEIVAAIDIAKKSNELNLHKTGSVENVKARIALFSGEVESIIGC